MAHICWQYIQLFLGCWLHVGCRSWLFYSTVENFEFCCGVFSISAITLHPVSINGRFASAVNVSYFQVGIFLFSACSLRPVKWVTL